MISFRYDAPEYTSAEIATALSDIASKREIAQDSYSRGGEVARFEAEIARTLGKERAIFMPTGTLANHLAIRSLSAKGNRVIVQEQSHIYNDMGDALTSLSGLNLIPLGYRRAHYTLEEAKDAWAAAADGRVKTGIGALAIESPVRRRHGEVFDFGEMSRLTSWAREKEIGSHLDGGRVFIASHYTKIPVREYAALFDTVYVSLYKYFGSPSGAVLAGPSALLDGMFHERRMFGGGLNQAWIFAALALEALPRFDEEFEEAVRISEALIGLLSGSGDFVISRIPNGSNIFVLELAEGKSKMAGASRAARGASFAEALRRRAILLPEAISGQYFLKVNTSLCGHEPYEIRDAFVAAAAEA